MLYMHNTTTVSQVYFVYKQDKTVGQKTTQIQPSENAASYPGK